MSEITALQKMSASGGLTSILLDKGRLDGLVRAAKMLAASNFMPDHLVKGGGDKAVANCAIVLAMADRMGEDAFTIGQYLHNIHGRIGWAAEYIISRANSSGLLVGGIRWRYEGSGDGLNVIAYAKLASDPEGPEITAEVSMKMARAEGWTKNSKYGTMPKHMLRYRSAAFLVRQNIPQVMMGFQTAEELRDARNEPRDVTPPHERSAESQRATAVIVDALGLDDEPEAVDPPFECEAEIVAPDGSEQAGFEWAPEEGE